MLYAKWLFLKWHSLEIGCTFLLDEKGRDLKRSRQFRLSWEGKFVYIEFMMCGIHMTRKFKNGIWSLVWITCEKKPSPFHPVSWSVTFSIATLPSIYNLLFDWCVSNLQIIVAHERAKFPYENANLPLLFVLKYFVWNTEFLNTTFWITAWGKQEIMDT